MARLQIEPVEPEPAWADPTEGLFLAEGEFVARLMDCGDEDEVRAYQELRYEHYVLRKGWVNDDPAHPGRETDRYDPYCHHLGVFQGPQLVAYLRVLPWQADPGFMLEHEFRNLISEDAAMELGQQGTIEAPRLVVAPLPSSGRSETVVLAELLFKLVYYLGKLLGWTAYYIVLEEAWLRVLQRRFAVPFAPLGVPQTYPDGARTLAAYARCDTLEQSILAASPEKYHWYREDTSR